MNNKQERIARGGEEAPGEDFRQGEYERLFSMIDEIDEIIYVADMETYEVLYANQAAQIIFGKPLAGGLCYRELQALEAPCPFCSNAILLTLGGQSYRWEHHNAKTNRDYAVVDRLIRWSDGRDARFELARDITDRKRTEAALHDSEAKYRLLVESADEAIVIAQDGMLKYVNRIAGELTGYSEQELTSRPFAEFIHPDDRDMVMEHYLRRFKGEASQPRYTMRLMTRDGNIRWAEAHAILVDWEGQPATLNFLTDITERKRAEEALLESEEQFQTIFENSSSAMAIIERDTTISMVNRKYCEMSLYQKQEVIGMSWTKQIPPDDLERLKEYNRKRLIDPNNAPSEYDFAFYRKDGEIRHSLISLGILPSSQKIVASFIDVTERKKAEEALQRQQAMLARTEGIAHVGSWEWEIATDTVTWSEELFRIFQRDPREGAPSFADHPAFYHSDDMVRLQQAVEAAVAQGTPYELELRAIRKDGETRVVVARGIAEMSPGGRAVRLFGSLQDITSHKRAEEALQESEEQYRILFETMTEGVVLISPDGQILHANPAAERILRLTRSEMEGRQYDGPGWALLRPDGGALPPEDVAGSFTKEKIRPLKDVEIGFKHADGSFSWVTVNATPLLDQAGKLKSVVGTFRDITEREQLKRETARKITSELTAGIAHQIRNPLFVISLSVQSIEKKLSTKDPQRRLTQAILDKVHKLDEVTASLVHLGKYHRLLITNASLRKCLEQALILVRAPAKVQRVKVVRHYYPNLPRAWIDVEAMDEVFANLLTNALEAMPEGGLLTVETDLDVERKELLVRIQDDGCGIPKAAQENIFIPFSTTKESGSGLGLVFCQRIVEEHGGRLTFYSEAEGEDHGTTFQITLPVSHAALGRRE